MTFLRIVCGCILLGAASLANAATQTFFGYGSAWPYRLGTNEASSPDLTTWRTNSDTSGWSQPVATPIGYGDPVPATIIPGSGATAPTWLTVFMRKTFVVANPAALANATLSINIDDGFIIWINGTEVGRFNVPAGAPTIAMAAVTAGEPVVQTLTVSPALLRAGTNVIAIQSFNANTTSSDHYVDASLVATVDDVAPDILFQLPFAGSTLPSLTQIEVDFTEPVTGVNVTDLLINGIAAATNMTTASSSAYIFRFPQPPMGPVSVQFEQNHGIKDLAAAANPFGGGSWTYILDTNVVLSEEIRINELVTANVSGLRDENNEQQDWVELKNLSTNLVSIAGWSLTDDEDTPDKWVFPAVTIPGNGYLVVFCSEKDRKPVAPGSKLHTNFKLDPDGEFIGLYNADVPRKLISSFNPYPNQRRDYSYGYDPAGQLRYFALPSPSSNNFPSAITGIVADVKFSVDRGFYTNGFSLSLTCATPGVTIRYTLDGKAPTTNVGSTYSTPLVINNTTVLRAFAYKANNLPSDIDCHTYLFLNDVITQSANGSAPPGWPATWGGNTVDYGMDPEIVTNALYKDTIKNDLKAIPTFSVVLNLDDMFSAGTGIYANPGNDGPGWERPCSIELIHPDGEEGYQANCGIRLRGGFSRSTSNPKHAFRFFFRQEYGLSKLNFPMFGSTGADSFDKFDMRTMQNYSWSFQNDSRMVCLRDVMSRDAQLAMNGMSARGDFYHLYVNGQYWGLFNSEERPEAAFAESYLGGREEDYDTIKQLDGYISGPTDGNTDAWFRLWYAATNGFANDVDYFKVQGLNVDGTINTNYENLVDVPNLIDYMLVILYGGNLDAPISNFLGNDSPNNWYGFRDRTGKHGGFRFVSHDAEHTLLNVNEDRTGIVDSGPSGPFGVINSDWTCGNPLTQAGGASAARDRSTPQYVWFRMHQNAEFRMLAADRIQKHCFNGGPLSVEGMRSAFMARSNEIQRAIVAESARWGDAKTAVPYNRGTWISAMGGAMSFVNGRTAILVSQLRNDGLLPTVNAPSLNSRGGAVSNGFTLFIANNAPSSVVYYTLDGTDPRMRGGNIAPSALAYTPGTPLVINFPTTVRARSRSGTTWSPITEATLYPAQDFSGLMFTEIMFHPPQGDTLEFLELKNAGSSILDLSDIEFSKGFQFTFPYGTRLMPGEFYVLGRDRAALTNRYPGLTVHGLYSGHLDNAGENLELTSAVGTRVTSVEYKDGGRWPIAPDGLGFSLVPRNPNSNPNPDNPTSWRASTNPGGSPGSDDPAPAIPAVLVNEALTHSDLPAVDYIELYNPTAGDVDLGGWFLTDDRAVPMKYRIPNGTMIPAGGYVVFTETNFNATPGTNNSFSLSSQGESVYLLSGDVATTNATGYSHGFTFDAAPTGVSFGRHVISTSDERFALQTSPTPNAPNSGPAVGPVVIRQFMYHPNDLPGGLDNQADEYIELRNLTGSPVQLFDPAIRTNTWRLRGGAEFNFPTNLTLGAHQSLLLVSFDPANAAMLSAFRGKFGVFSGVPIYGPYSGKLDNSSDTLKIQRADTPETNGVPYVLVDGLDYKDAAPWPPGADGSGQALQRLSMNAYADDPANWIGTAPLTILGVTPSSANVRAGTNAATATNVTFSVSAVGTGALSYQWRKEGTDIPGATTDSLTLSDVQLDDQGNYSVRVSDTSGSAMSPNVYVGVYVVPFFLQAPLSQTVVRGQTMTLSCVITGSPPPFTFTWKRNSATNAVHVSNSTSDYYTYVVTNAPGTYPWRVVINNSATDDAGIISGVSHALVANMVVLADTDNDGVPDAWETANGFSTTNAADAALDADGDTMTNWEEYIAGTNPTNALSYLKLDGVLGVGAVSLSFQALSNRTYAVEFKNGLGSPSWTRLAEFPARSSDHIETVLDPNSSTNRFYRLETPRGP